MCGIFGSFFIRPDRRGAARDALDTLVHRGPDQRGEWTDEIVFLGHRRLSILDLSEKGRQPFVDERGDVAVMVNGEIYNYPELRRELGEASFRSGSDSEVVLHGYRAWGVDRLLQKLNGMFALVIYDRRERRLYLAKDRWGKKPLFYAVHRDEFVFASEAKAILQYLPEMRVFSLNGIRRWMAHRGSHHDSTIFAGISRLAPGTYLQVDAGPRIQRRRYYDLLEMTLAAQEREPARNGSLTEELRERLSRATGRRLLSDVPVGLQLSGGVDSSVVAGLLRDFSGEEMHTFSVVFSEPEWAHYSEEPYSLRVAEQWGYQHHSFGIDRAQVAEAYPHVLWLADGMLDFPNTIPMYLLNRHAKERVTVMLTGEGADELLGGYGKFRHALALSRGLPWGRGVPGGVFERQWSGRMQFRFLRPAFLSKHYAGKQDRILEDLNAFISPGTFTRLFGPPPEHLIDGPDRAELQRLPFDRRVLAADHLTYLYSVLDRQDRAAMGASVETRSPFMDRELVEWAAGIPPQDLFDSAGAKKPLKQLSAAMYGDEFTYRRKMGFPLPLEQWLEDPTCFRPFYERALERDFILYEHVNRKAVLEWLDSAPFGRRLINYAHAERIWVQWFLMVLRGAQDVFSVSDIREE